MADTVQRKFMGFFYSRVGSVGMIGFKEWSILYWVGNKFKVDVKRGLAFGSN